MKRYEVPFPKCDHRDRPQRYEETGYEWFDSACDECYQAWRSACRLVQIKHYTKGPWKAELNSAGLFSIFTPGSTGKRSKRPDGLWMTTAAKPEEMALWREHGADTEVTPTEA